MSSTVTDNNKRIAKNTLILYLRMFLIMAVSLYTSRIVLNALGVVDFGIFNVVAGVIAMMGVLNGSMAAATQRYYNISLGKKDTDELNKVFSASVWIYISLSILFLILAETIGLWFVNTKLVLPADRLIAANWIYQFSVISCIFSLISNPYNAMIIAEERMDVFAYVSVFEAFLKLVIVYLIMLIPFDRLIIYGLLYAIMTLLVSIVYICYCYKNFSACKLTHVNDKDLYKNILSFSGWNLFGSISGLIKGQGLNVLLNLFFSPAVNASRGIAYQVNSTVSQFFTNFYTAVRPQITKYYAQNDYQNLFKLIFRSSKLSYYLILFISLPLTIEAPFVINLWLGQLPEYVVIFVRIIILITAIDAMAAPLMTTANATGRVALYQLSVGIVILLNIPISYIFLIYSYPPIIVFVVSLVISIIALFMRIFIVKYLIKDFPAWSYIKDTFFRSVIVTFVASLIPICIHVITDDGFISFLYTVSTSVISCIIFIAVIGLNKEERSFICQLIKSKLI